MSGASSFKFQQFSIKQNHCAMKVGIDSVLLGAWTPPGNALNILDIGTGTGILALMMAQKSHAYIDAVEIDENAFLQASENFEVSPFAGQIKCYHSSILSFPHHKHYDLIISNPPYFDENIRSGNSQRDTARHSSHLDLSELIDNAYSRLSKQGKLALILPYHKKEKVINTAVASGLHCHKLLTIKGKETKSPNRLLFLFQKQYCKTIAQEMSIYQENGKYTKEFKGLTKDFYLPSIFR